MCLLKYFEFAYSIHVVDALWSFTLLLVVAKLILCIKLDI